MPRKLDEVQKIYEFEILCTDSKQQKQKKKSEMMQVLDIKKPVTISSNGFE